MLLEEANLEHIVSDWQTDMKYQCNGTQHRFQNDENHLQNIREDTHTLNALKQNNNNKANAQYTPIFLCVQTYVCA